jgi:hypothetical protein
MSYSKKYTTPYRFGRIYTEDGAFDTIEIIFPNMPISLCIFIVNKLTESRDSTFLPANWFCVY